MLRHDAGALHRDSCHYCLGAFLIRKPEPNKNSVQCLNFPSSQSYIKRNLTVNLFLQFCCEIATPSVKGMSFKFLKYFSNTCDYVMVTKLCLRQLLDIFLSI